MRGRSGLLVLSSLAAVALAATAGCAAARTEELEAELRRLRARVETLEAAGAGGGAQAQGTADPPAAGDDGTLGGASGPVPEPAQVAAADGPAAGDAATSGDPASGDGDGDHTPAGETQRTVLGDQAPISAAHSRERGGRIHDEATPKDQGAGAQGPGPRGAPETAGAGAAGPARQEPSTPTDSRPPLFNLHVWGVGDVELHGSLDVAYNYNPAISSDEESALRLATADNETFELEWAKIGFARPVTPKNAWDGGGRLDVVFGTFVERTISLSPRFLEGKAVNVGQAYVDMQAPTPLGRPLLIRAGRFYGWFGVESPELPLNVNFSVSYLFQNTPFTTTGVGVGLDLVDGLRYTQYLVNGWDVVVDDNGAKTVGGQLAWTMNDPQTTIAFNWIYGAEQPKDSRDDRLLLELDATWQVLHRTELVAAAQWGQEQHAPSRPDRARTRWGGVLLILKQDILNVRAGLDRLGVAIRGEWVRDQGGPRTGVDHSLWEVTVTFEIDFTENVRLGLEYRHDDSDHDVFPGPRGPGTRSYQDTYSVDFALIF